MKRIVFSICIALLLFPTFACAQPAYTLDERAVLSGMGVSWQQGYAPDIEDGVMTIHLPIVSANGSGRVSAELILPEDAPSPFTGSGMSDTFSRGDSGYWRVVLTPKLSKKRVNGDYACIVRLSGDAGTAELPLTIRIRDGQNPTGEMRPVIRDVSADFRVGENATLTATLQNPSRYAALTNMSLTVSDATGDILPAGTNILPLDDLAPGASMEIAVPLTVRANASVSLHTLAFTLRFSALEQGGTWEESFTMPISQDIRMEIGSVEMATTIIQGNMATIALPVMNMGRADILNTMVKLTLPGVTDGHSALIGTIAPGSTGTARITVIPGDDVLGPVSGTLHVTCEDNWGNTAEQTIPVSLTVEEPPPAVELGAEEERKEQPEWLVFALGGACALLALGMIVQGALLGRKIRRLEEDRL